MAKPSFKTLWNNYPKSGRQGLFDDIGWSDLADKPTFKNTCAIRMSVCLQKSGIDVKSSAFMKALDGPLKGKYIEISQTKLSDQLSVLWGEPEIIKPPEMEKTLDGRDGVASFFDIPGYQVGDRLGGHIDVIDGTKWSLLNWNWLRPRSYQCGSGCYFDSGKIWFWELT